MPIRKAPRFQTEQAVTANWTNGGKHAVSGYTRDVSTAGLFFYAEFAPDSGSQIEIMVTLPAEVTGSDAQTMLCRGRVVRVEASEETPGLPPRYGIAMEMDSCELIGES